MNGSFRLNIRKPYKWTHDKKRGVMDSLRQGQTLADVSKSYSMKPSTIINMLGKHYTSVTQLQKEGAA